MVFRSSSGGETAMRQEGHSLDMTESFEGVLSVFKARMRNNTTMQRKKL